MAVDSSRSLKINSRKNAIYHRINTNGIDLWKASLCEIQVGPLFNFNVPFQSLVQQTRSFVFNFFYVTKSRRLSLCTMVDSSIVIC